MSSVVVQVTFVGGPLHGVSEEIIEPGETFWRYVNTVGAVLYGRRWSSSETLLGADLTLAVYAPVGMSSPAYRALLAKVLGLDHPAQTAAAGVTGS